MIMRSFFMVAPPKFMVISATLQLPGVDTSDYAGQIRHLKRKIRETEYQGERFADQIKLDSELLNEKRALLSKMPPKGQRKAWHDRLQQINVVLSRELASARASLRTELVAAERKATSQALLASREHPFCVFPLEYLTETYRSLLRG
jgi:hypothetical protein